MAGVARVVAVVSGDPQDPVLDVVHPVGCHFGAAVHECSATGRRRFARQVRVVQGLQSNVSALRSPLGVYHCSSGWTEIRGARRRALNAPPETITNYQQEDDDHIPSVMLPDAEQGYHTPGACRH